jgi:cytochrome c oxidase subunit 4
MNAHAHAHAQTHEDPGHHHIASFRSLFTILVILLVMTALTVYTARYVHIGEAGNLILAMFIACFKATLVCAIFMHLLHDKLLNTIVLILCLCLVVCFIGFTSIDMVSRGALDPTRKHFIGPPPMADADVQAAIEKANAAHAEHAPADGAHAPTGDADHPPAAEQPADDGHH